MKDFFAMARKAAAAVVALTCLASNAAAQDVLLEFTRPHDCAPCRAMIPLMAQLRAEGAAIQSIDCEQPAGQRQMAAWQITTTPTYVVLRQGRETARLVGLQSLNSLRRALAPLPGAARADVKTAAVVRISGDGEAAFSSRLAQRFAECRRSQSLALLGHELAPWPTPVELSVRFDETSGGGATHFAYDAGRLLMPIESRISGRPELLLADVVPHEVLHMVLASHFRRPLPRWIDEGLATRQESAVAQRRQWQCLLQSLSEGRGVPFDRMLEAMQYPREPQEVMALYAQSWSTVEFLTAQSDQAYLCELLAERFASGRWNWSKYFDYAGAAELQAAWLDWVAAGAPAAPEQVVALRPIHGRCALAWRWFPRKRLWQRIHRERQVNASTPAATPAVALPSTSTASVAAPQVSGPSEPVGDAAWQPRLDQMAQALNALDGKVDAQGASLAQQIGQLAEQLPQFSRRLDETRRDVSHDKLRGAVADATSDLRQQIGDARAAVEPQRLRGLIATVLKDLGPWAASSTAHTVEKGILTAIGISNPVAGAIIAAVSGLLGAGGMAWRGRRKQKSAANSAADSSPPIVIHQETKPLPQVVERDREFVQVQVKTNRQEALERAMDELGRRNPGMIETIQTIENYASQYQSGLGAKRG